MFASKHGLLTPCISFLRPKTSESLVLFGVFPKPLRRYGLGALKRQAECAVPEKLRQGADPARNAEQHRVVVVLGEVVVAQEHARVCVDVGPRVLDLAQLCQHVRDHLCKYARSTQTRANR